MGLRTVVFNAADWPTQDQVPDTSQCSFLSSFFGCADCVGRHSGGAGVAY
jgi:hypothetical protein